MIIHTARAFGEKQARQRDIGQGGEASCGAQVPSTLKRDDPIGRIAGQRAV